MNLVSFLTFSHGALFDYHIYIYIYIHIYIYNTYIYIFVSVLKPFNDKLHAKMVLKTHLLKIFFFFTEASSVCI